MRWNRRTNHRISPHGSTEEKLVLGTAPGVFILKEISMLRKYRLWITLLVVLAAAGGGYFYYAAASQPAQATDDEQVRTTTARQGDLVIYASGTGTLVAGSEVDLSFGISGVLQEINVQVGDLVQAGDNLARLEEGESLESLQTAVTSAEIARLNAQNSLDELYESAPMKAAQAQQTLAEALDNLQDAEYYWQVQQSGYRASGETIAAAEAGLVLAENEVEKAQARFNDVEGKPDDDPARALALSNLVAAKQKRDSAMRELNWYTGSPTEIDQMLLDAEVAIAEAALAEAQAEWETLQNGPDPVEVSLAEAQLANAEAQLVKAQADLADGTAALEDINLVAPIDGTVLAVNANVGDSAQGVVITLADLNQPYLEIFLDETDLDKIARGFAVDVIFDALPDDTFTGEVVQIDPTLYSSQNVSAIRALVKLDDPHTAGISALPIGLNAAVDVVSGRADDAVLVPIEALRELSPSEYAVFVMDEGEPKLRMVSVGLIDFTYAEITSGLDAGEIVTTGIVETGR
jgi:RND family efflux transporter MFP subunit